MVKHWFHIAGEAREVEANEAPYAVGDRVSLDMPPPQPNRWVRITGKRSITNNAKTVNVHWDCVPD